MTKISTLKNGIRIATHNIPGHFATAGVFIEAGSRFESKSTEGCAHFIERMTFKSTINFSSRELVEKMELLGGQIQSQTTREHIQYQGSVFHKDVEELVGMLSEMTRFPLFKEEEVKEAKINTLHEINDNEFKSEVFLPEMLHTIAYGGFEQKNTLGYSQKVGAERLPIINSSQLHEYRNQWFTPNRVVVCAVGVDHESFVEIAAKYFEDWQPASDDVIIEQRMATGAPHFTGGTFIKDTSALPQSPNPDDMILTHCQIAFEGLGATDPDIYALATLGSLLGGGGSFSAGGPGKGMYTRLYTQVLNRNGWVESCNVINHTHKDSGIFGIHVAVPSDHSTHEHLPHVICDQLLTCTTTCTATELNRAKNQLKSNLLMALESQPTELEDIGRQVLAYGQRLNVMEMCRRIDLVEASDVINVGRRVFLGESQKSRFDFGDIFCHPSVRTGDGKPAVLVHGNLTGKRDPLWNVEESVAKWGLLKLPESSGRKRGWFSRL